MITWTISPKFFPTPDHIAYTKDQINGALAEWGIKGIQFQYIDDKQSSKATFIVKYSSKPSGGTIARAFFPSSEQADIMIYPIAFDRSWIKLVRNVLAHELGHVYGLRHEFALQEGDTVQFGPSNPASVMNYNNPPIIQDSDRVWLQKLYDKTNQVNFIGSPKFPVHRYAPFSG